MTGPPAPGPISGCALASTELEAQLERYRRLGGYATDIRRLSGEATIRFRADLPSGLLADTLEVERSCCPFLHAAYDPKLQELRLSVDTIDQAPMLESLLHALSPSEAA